MLRTHEYDQVIKRLRELQRLQEKYAAVIVAGGILNDNDPWTSALAAVAEPKAAESQKALTDWFARLEQASPDSTMLRHPLDQDPENTDFAEDVLTSYGVAWGDAGFLLGVAVGMQLGPWAFNGIGVKKAGRR